MRPQGDQFYSLITIAHVNKDVMKGSVLLTKPKTSQKFSCEAQLYSWDYSVSASLVLLCQFNFNFKIFFINVICINMQYSD